MKLPVLFVAMSLASGAALAAKPCEELKGEIAAKIDANHVSGYALEIVANDQVGDRKVVGSCEGSTKKIVYARHAGAHAQDAAGSEDSAKK
ncbi:MAG: DUF1161 domain-containing protein [Steroidobacterales bacterium]